MFSISVVEVTAFIQMCATCKKHYTEKTNTHTYYISQITLSKSKLQNNAWKEIKLVTGGVQRKACTKEKLRHLMHISGKEKDLKINNLSAPLRKVQKEGQFISKAKQKKNSNISEGSNRPSKKKQQQEMHGEKNKRNKTKT